jgi:polyvinyl alcohol dehydrogenase (cytochrome)
VFSGSEDGHLRAYATDTGKVLWDTDTARSFYTVNELPARGGSIDGSGGPVAIGGILLTPSGYSKWREMPGNVLLAYDVGP